MYELGDRLANAKGLSIKAVGFVSWNLPYLIDLIYVTIQADNIFKVIPGGRCILDVFCCSYYCN